MRHGQALLDARAQLVDARVLGDVLGRSVAHCPDGRVGRAVLGQHHQDGLRAVAAKALRQRERVDSRLVVGAQDQGGVAFGRQGQRGSGIVGHHHFQPVLLQDPDELTAEVDIVLDDQHRLVPALVPPGQTKVPGAPHRPTRRRSGGERRGSHITIHE